MAIITARVVSLFHLLLLLPQWVQAVSNLRSLHRRDGVPEDASDRVPSYNFTMPLDHFNEHETRTYNNRYWMNDTYYKAGGPVFFYDFGESEGLESTAAGVLAETGGPTNVMQLAQHYHGMAIGWEHRYYGTSQPFPDTIVDKQHGVNGSKETWQYLTNEQALEDTVYFAHHFTPQGFTEEEAAAMSPTKVPWIFIGGSYPGNRAAWIRLRNPETFYAAWSSSAPVQTRFDGHLYFDPIASALPSNCSADVTAVINYADDIMSSKFGKGNFTQLQQLVYAAYVTADGFNTTLDLDWASAYSVTEIASFLMTPFYGTFQYDGPSRTTDIFCRWMQTYNPAAVKVNPEDLKSTYYSIFTNPGNATATDEGLVRHWGLSAALQAYVYALRRWQAYQNSQATYSSSRIFEDTWTYQFLSEFGYIQGSLPEKINVVSKFYNYTYVHDSTVEYTFEPGIVPDVPDVQQAIDKYGGWNMQPSNVMFTNGEFDPWRAFSVMSDEGDDGAPKRTVTKSIPQCNKSGNGTDVFGLLYPGAVHVEDFFGTWGSTDDFAYQGLSLFTQALDEWLPCFEPKC